MFCGGSGGLMGTLTRSGAGGIGKLGAGGDVGDVVEPVLASSREPCWKCCVQGAGDRAREYGEGHHGGRAED